MYFLCSRDEGDFLFNCRDRMSNAHDLIAFYGIGMLGGKIRITDIEMNLTN